MKVIEEPIAMKEGMRRLASGVSVLSAVCEKDGRHAMTVSSVTSVSNSPASLLVCINELTIMHDVLVKEGDRFAINVLASEQENVSNVCAGLQQDLERFDVGQWQESSTLPYLADAEAVFFCKFDKAVQYGTHKIIIGCIENVLVSEGDINPLIYLNGNYHGITLR